MFKFLFGKKDGKAVQENQRQTVERTLGELNAILGQMAEKPSISIDLNTGALAIELPEQMPDEALALPAPEKVAEKVEEVIEPEAEKTAA